MEIIAFEEYGLVALQSTVTQELFVLMAEFSVPCVFHGKI